MIAQLAGKISHKAERFVILDVGGVGYRLFLSAESLKTSRVDGNARFWTHLAVRENALELYGFHDRQELEFFELLLEVPGIGPKSAIAILSLSPPAILKRAITAGDSSYLTKVSGIGKKNADKIVVILRDKLADLPSGETVADLKEEAEALEALVALGYGQREAREALRRVGQEHIDTGAKVKAALKFLGK